MDNTSWKNSNWDGTDSSNEFGGEAKFCPNCGEKLPGGAAFCPYCGFKFSGILSGSDSEPDVTAELHGQGDDPTFKFDNSIPPAHESTSQNLYEYDSGSYDNYYIDPTPPPKKKKPVGIHRMTMEMMTMLLLRHLRLLRRQRQRPSRRQRRPRSQQRRRPRQRFRHSLSARSISLMHQPVS